MEETGHVVVCQDAHMNEVYLGLYSAGQVPKLLCPERIQSIAAIEEAVSLIVAARNDTSSLWQRSSTKSKRARNSLE